VTLRHPRNTRVELRLERPGHGPVPVDFERHWGELTSGEGPHLLSGLQFGEEDTSQLLTPGDCVLVAKTRDGRTPERTVRLVSGQTTFEDRLFE